MNGEREMCKIGKNQRKVTYWAMMIHVEDTTGRQIVFRNKVYQTQQERSYNLTTCIFDNDAPLEGVWLRIFYKLTILFQCLRQCALSPVEFFQHAADLSFLQDSQDG